MIQISPALLCTDISEFRDQLKGVADHFDLVDIDLNIDKDNFDGVVTVNPVDALKEARKYSNDFNIHLMVSKPLGVIKQLEDSGIELKKYRFLIHQESEYEAALEKYPKLNVGIVIKAESELNSIKFYKSFPEVQLMTIETGKQGNEFIPEILDRVEWLRENGYKKIVSLDGSINLGSAALVNNYNVDRVSVGSFISKSEDVALAKYKLDLALNMKSDLE